MVFVRAQVGPPNAGDPEELLLCSILMKKEI